ncbi:MAG: TRAM domain-containing protein, partial [Firmicutes bacterium]|nr:TRAM domain-containing protein [Bacillota bacterium]
MTTTSLSLFSKTSMRPFARASFSPSAIVSWGTPSQRHSRMAAMAFSTLKEPGMLSGRTDGFKLVDFPGDEKLIGTFTEIEITEGKTFSLKG